jgi:O-antigen/teichoic acid export membrane protein
MSVIKNISYTFLTQIPTIILSVAASIFSTRVIGAAGSGEVALFQSYVQIFILLFCFSFHTAVTYFVSSGKIAAEKMTGLGMFILLSSTLLLALILGSDLLFFKVIPRYISGKTHVIVCIYLLASFFLTNLVSFIQPFLFSIKKFNTVNRMLIFSSSLNTLGLGIMFGLHMSKIHIFSLEQFLMLSVFVQSISASLWVYFFLKHYKIPNLFNIHLGDEIKGVMNFILIGHLSTFINFFNLQVDIWFVDHYCGKMELGYYSKAANIAQMLWLISNPIATILTPYLIEKNEGKADMFGFYSRLNGTLIIVSASILFLISPWFFPAFFGPDFVNSVFAFKVLLPGVVIMSLNKVFSVYVYSESKIFYNLLATVVGLAFTLSLDFTLIPKYGMMGAALASAVTYTAVTAVTFCSVIFVCKVPFRNYLFVNAQDIKKLTPTIRPQ